MMERVRQVRQQVSATRGTICASSRFVYCLAEAVIIGMSGIGLLLANGIQDVAALLPIVGTDKCEFHVGNALDGGYIYAAAAPLSVFGCLGIVKAGITILFASITWPFNGAAMLFNAGFEVPGSVGAMIAKWEGQDRDHYPSPWQTNAQEVFRSMLVAEHLAEPRQMHARYRRWNLELISASLLLGTIAFTPYIAILHDSDHKSSAWPFPLARILGSILCSVGAQFILQVHVRVGFSFYTAEKVNTTVLIPAQLAVVVGSIATAVGYIGSFNIVQSSSPRDTYLWLGLEGLLLLMRMGLWGWNPSFDDCRIHLRAPIDHLYSPRSVTWPIFLTGKPCEFGGDFLLHKEHARAPINYDGRLHYAFVPDPHAERALLTLVTNAVSDSASAVVPDGDHGVPKDDLGIVLKHDLSGRHLGRYLVSQSLLSDGNRSVVFLRPCDTQPNKTLKSIEEHSTKLARWFGSEFMLMVTWSCKITFFEIWDDEAYAHLFRRQGMIPALLDFWKGLPADISAADIAMQKRSGGDRV